MIQRRLLLAGGFFTLLIGIGSLSCKLPVSQSSQVKDGAGQISGDKDLNQVFDLELVDALQKKIDEEETSGTSLGLNDVPGEEIAAQPSPSSGAQPSPSAETKGKASIENSKPSIEGIAFALEHLEDSPNGSVADERMASGLGAPEDPASYSGEADPEGSSGRLGGATFALGDQSPRPFPQTSVSQSPLFVQASKNVAEAEKQGRCIYERAFFDGEACQCVGWGRPIRRFRFAVPNTPVPNAARNPKPRCPLLESDHCHCWEQVSPGTCGIYAKGVGYATNSLAAASMDKRDNGTCWHACDAIVKADVESGRNRIFSQCSEDIAIKRGNVMELWRYNRSTGAPIAPIMDSSAISGSQNPPMFPSTATRAAPVCVKLTATSDGIYPETCDATQTTTQLCKNLGAGLYIDDNRRLLPGPCSKYVWGERLAATKADLTRVETMFADGRLNDWAPGQPIQGSMAQAGGNSKVTADAFKSLCESISYGMARATWSYAYSGGGCNCGPRGISTDAFRAYSAIDQQNFVNECRQALQTSNGTVPANNTNSTYNQWNQPIAVPSFLPGTGIQTQTGAGQLLGQGICVTSTGATARVSDCRERVTADQCPPAQQQPYVLYRNFLAYQQFGLDCSRYPVGREVNPGGSGLSPNPGFGGHR